MRRTVCRRRVCLRGGLLGNAAASDPTIVENARLRMVFGARRSPF
jgi:hypothetical protein